MNIKNLDNWLMDNPTYSQEERELIIEAIENFGKEQSKKKYKVGWIESHNPLNWGDTYEKGVKNIFDSLPPDTHEIAIGNNDEWLDLECWDNFEAENDEKAYRHVVNNYEMQSGVFSIQDENGICIATEEGVEK